MVAGFLTGDTEGMAELFFKTASRWKERTERDGPNQQFCWRYAEFGISAAGESGISASRPEWLREPHTPAQGKQAA